MGENEIAILREPVDTRGVGLNQQGISCMKCEIFKAVTNDLLQRSPGFV